MSNCERASQLRKAYDAELEDIAHWRPSEHPRRNIGARCRLIIIKALRKDRVTPLLACADDLSLAGRVSKDSIDSLTRQITASEVGNFLLAFPRPFFFEPLNSA